jgi:prepilin-type N-terminal cleavage/methylation domain-containing protein
MNLFLSIKQSRERIRAGLPAACLPARQGRQGFTLIELLVVVAVIILVSAVIFANNNRFGGAALLQNLAYDIALSVREAQVYGISVKQNSQGTFSAGYGMHFALANSTTYNLFSDFKNGAGQLSSDGLYEAGEDVKPSPYKIGRSYYISKLCVTPASGPPEICSPTVQKIDILFIRPDPDAYISINSTALTFVNGVVVGGSPNMQARIVVASPRGDFMSVIVSQNGQISVAADPNGN